MDKKPNKIKLLNKLQKEQVLWSYNYAKLKKLSDNVLIEYVLLYLDIDEIIMLFQSFPKNRIKKIWQEKIIRLEPMYHNLNRMYALLFFNIKNPDRYISNHKRKILNHLLCKD